MQHFERLSIDCAEKANGCTTPTRRLRLTETGEPAGGTGWSSYSSDDGTAHYLCPACSVIRRAAALSSSRAN